MFQANHFPVVCGFECFSCCPSACVSFSLVIQVAFILKIIFYFWRSIIPLLLNGCLQLSPAALHCCCLPPDNESSEVSFLAQPRSHEGHKLLLCCYDSLARCPRLSWGPLPVSITADGLFSCLLLRSTCLCSSTAFFRQRCNPYDWLYGAELCKAGDFSWYFYCKNWNLPMLSEVASWNIYI